MCVCVCVCASLNSKIDTHPSSQQQFLVPTFKLTQVKFFNLRYCWVEESCNKSNKLSSGSISLLFLTPWFLVFWFVPCPEAPKEQAFGPRHELHEEKAQGTWNLSLRIASPLLPTNQCRACTLPWDLTWIRAQILQLLYNIPQNAKNSIEVINFLHHSSWGRNVVMLLTAFLCTWGDKDQWTPCPILGTMSACSYFRS